MAGYLSFFTLSFTGISLWEVHDLGEDDCICFWVFHIFTLILENGHETCPLNSCSIGQLVWGGEMRHEIWNLKILSPGWALLWRHCFRNLPPTSNHVPYQTAWVQTSAPLLFYPWRQQVMAQVVDLSPLTRDSQMDLPDPGFNLDQVHLLWAFGECKFPVPCLSDKSKFKKM